MIDRLAYAKYLHSEAERAAKAKEIYETIRELYGNDVSWKDAYFNALRDGVVSPEERSLVRSVYSLK